MRESAGEIAAVWEAVQNSGSAVARILKLCMNQEELTGTIRQNFDEISASISAQSASMMEVLSAIEKLNDIMRDFLDANDEMKKPLRMPTCR